MPNKIKALIVFMALVAGFSVYQFISVFRHDKDQKILGANMSGQFTSSSSGDTDGDGLTDTQESYWNTDFRSPDTDGDGFRDGEEVITGHDPRKKGPDDLLNPPENISEKASSLIVGGLLDGSLRKGTADSQKAIIELANSISEQSLLSTALTIPSTIPLILVPVTPENNSRYTKQLNPVLESIQNIDYQNYLTTMRMLSTLPKEEGQEKDKFRDQLKTSVSHLEQTISQLKSVEVPENLKTQHQQFVATLIDSSKSYEALNTLDEDEMKSVTAILTLQVIFRIKIGYLAEQLTI